MLQVLIFILALGCLLPTADLRAAIPQGQDLALPIQPQPQQAEPAKHLSKIKRWSKRRLQTKRDSVFPNGLLFLGVLLGTVNCVVLAWLLWQGLAVWAFLTLVGLLLAILFMQIHEDWEDSWGTWWHSIFVYAKAYKVGLVMGYFLVALVMGVLMGYMALVVLSGLLLLSMVVFAVISPLR